MTSAPIADTSKLYEIPTYEHLRAVCMVQDGGVWSPILENVVMAPDRMTDRLNHDEVVAACMTCLVGYEHEGRPSPAKAYSTAYSAPDGTTEERHPGASKR